MEMMWRWTTEDMRLVHFYSQTATLSTVEICFSAAQCDSLQSVLYCIYQSQHTGSYNLLNVYPYRFIGV